LEENDDTNGYAGNHLPGDRQYKRTGQSDGFRPGAAARDRHPGMPGQAASPAASAELLLLDLSVQNSIRSAVAEFEKRYDHLDVLINNAAVFKPQRTLTADGYETMFATNHLGPFLLSNLLLHR